jgi:hypothetical protein
MGFFIEVCASNVLGRQFDTSFATCARMQRVGCRVHRMPSGRVGWPAGCVVTVYVLVPVFFIRKGFPPRPAAGQEVPRDGFGLLGMGLDSWASKLVRRLCLVWPVYEVGMVRRDHSLLSARLKDSKTDCSIWLAAG